ncbi:MAG: response regulator, partial [Pseudomonadota bacterium]
MSELAAPNTETEDKPEAPHILVVDDDKRLRRLLSRYLGENGFRVTVADSAEQARRQFSGLQFDLAVVDIMMPGEDGTELTTAIRRGDGLSTDH